MANRNSTFLVNVLVQVEIDGPDETVIVDALQDYIGEGDGSFRVHSAEVLDFEELS